MSGGPLPSSGVMAAPGYGVVAMAMPKTKAGKGHGKHLLWHDPRCSNLALGNLPFLLLCCACIYLHLGDGEGKEEEKERGGSL